jgi:hypothetical protein
MDFAIMFCWRSNRELVIALITERTITTTSNAV